MIGRAVVNLEEKKLPQIRRHMYGRSFWMVDDWFTLYRGWPRPSEMRVNVNVFGLRMRLLLVMLGEVGWRGAHHSWWRLHLGTQRQGAVSHVWGDEGLQGLLGQWAPVLLEGRRSSWTRRVVLLGLQLLLMRRRHSGGWLLIGKRRGNGEEGKPKQPVKTHFFPGRFWYHCLQPCDDMPTSQFTSKNEDDILK